MNKVNPTSHTRDIAVFLQSIYVRGFHGEQIRHAKEAVGLGVENSKPSKQQLNTLAKYLNKLDQPYQIQGVDFSRAQISLLMNAHTAGYPIEFETFGPYLTDYLQYEGDMHASHLIPEDSIGLSLAGVMRRFFPSARLISLYDEYNVQKGTVHRSEELAHFTRWRKENFRASLLALLQYAAIVPEDAVDGKDYLLIPESSRVPDADHLVTQLESRGFIFRRGDEIVFVNEDAENPLYQRVILRTKQGRWLCEALDAATFLKPENQKITHLVVLPDYMKAQQDKVWEILRTLNIPRAHYHNIFYNPTMLPQTAVRVVTEVFETAEMFLADKDSIYSPESL